MHKSAEATNAAMQVVRGAFEYQGLFSGFITIILNRTHERLSGQKCSALSRLYVSSSVWESGFKEQLLAEVAKIKVGPARDFSCFMGPVMCVSTSYLAQF